MKLFHRKEPGAYRPKSYGRHDYLLIVAFVLTVGVAMPLFVNGLDNQYLINLWLLYSVAALGFYLVFCVAGRFAFSQIVMMSIGGYFSALVALYAPIWVAVLCAIVGTALFALLFALATYRANYFYFGIATLALTEIATTVFNNWTGFAGQGGARFDIPPLAIFGHAASTQRQYFWIFLGALFLALLLAAQIAHSPLQREAMATRDLPEVAETLGVPVIRIQIVMFVIGSAFAGLSGSFYAHWQGTMSSGAFGLDLGVGIFLMVILGGARSLWGPVAGAAFYVFVPNALQSVLQYPDVLYGGLLVVLLILLPDGLAGIVAQLRGQGHRSTQGGVGGVALIRTRLLQLVRGTARGA